MQDKIAFNFYNHLCDIWELLGECCMQLKDIRARIGKVWKC